METRTGCSGTIFTAQNNEKPAHSTGYPEDHASGLSGQLPDGRILQPQLVDKVVELVRHGHLVGGGIETPLVIRSQHVQRLLDVGSRCLQHNL